MEELINSNGFVFLVICASLFVIDWITRNKMFVKPVELEKTRRQILEEIDKKYAGKSEINNINRELSEIKGEQFYIRSKIDNIYDLLTKRG